MNYIKESGKVYSLIYHLVFVVKYRKKVFIDDNLINRLKDIFQNISKDFDVEIIEQEVGEDHIHLLISTKPTLDITKYINIMKGHSSRRIRDEFKSFLKDYLWGDNFWSPSYFISSCGNVSIDVLKQYIENQRKEKDEEGV